MPTTMVGIIFLKRHAGAEEIPVPVWFAGIVAVVRDRDRKGLVGEQGGSMYPSRGYRKVSFVA